MDGTPTCALCRRPNPEAAVYDENAGEVRLCQPDDAPDDAITCYEAWTRHGRRPMGRIIGDELAAELVALNDPATLLLRRARAEAERWALLRAAVPSIANEYGYAPSASQLSVAAITPQLFRVTSIVATLPNASTGLLQLADLTIPLPQGLTKISVPGDGGMMLQIGDTRLLQSSVAGPLSLWLSGVIHPTWGYL